MKKPSLKKIKPKLPSEIPGPFRRKKATEERVTEALRGVPRITNETVAEHREAVLSSARKYIYPLKHSKHRVVRTSISLLIIVVVLFFVYCVLSLYRFQATNGFMYDVTRVVPFPVAKAGSSWVSYESYLFELRRNMHYYVSQQQATFETKDGKAQLNSLKEQAMNQVIENAYVKQLANQNRVTVSSQQVNTEVQLLRGENRLGSSDRDFKDVLNEFWGWDESDFKRELQQQLLQQAVVAKLDSKTNNRAQAALSQLINGADFATVASQVSDDLSTRASGGAYPVVVTPTNTSLPPAVTAALYELKPGQVSGIVNTGYTLEILKVIDRSGGSMHAAHIQFTYQQIGVYLKPLENKEKSHAFIKT